MTEDLRPPEEKGPGKTPRASDESPESPAVDPSRDNTYPDGSPPHTASPAPPAPTHSPPPASPSPPAPSAAPPPSSHHPPAGWAGQGSFGGASGGGPDPWGGWFGRLLMPVFDSKGWLKFMGVVLIMSGVLTALTLVGIIIAWLYIWLGVLLWQAGDRANQAATLREPVMLEQYLQKIKTIVVIAGVTTAASIVLSIFTLVITIALGWTAAWMEMINF